MRHHRRADDPGGEQDALGAGEAGDEEVLATSLAVAAWRRRARRRRRRRRRRPAPRSPPPAGGSRVCCRARIAKAPTPAMTPAGNSGIPKSRLSPSAAPTTSAMSVGHRHHLGLQPEADRGAAREALAAELGEVLAGGDPELRRLRLDQHRDQVGREHHPEQQVAELGAAGDVGGEVAGVDVGDRGDEGGAEEGPDAADAAGVAVERAARRLGDRGLAGQDVLDRRLRCAGPASAGACLAPAGGSRSGPGIGVPCGSWLGSPSLAAISCLELLGDVVLEHLGLLVDAVPASPAPPRGRPRSAGGGGSPPAPPSPPPGSG